MILNVSGRCDIPAFFTDWFMTRYKEGFVDVRNPFYPKQVTRINFSDVDLILFVSKNPIPIVDKLKLIDKPILFHITLTPYGKDIEPGVMDKKKVIESIKEISKIIGNENVYVRYDPIFLNDKYNLSYHIKAFNKLCSLLDGYVKHIIISFIDDYKNVRKNYKYLKYKEITKEDLEVIGVNFSEIAKVHGMTVQTCSEEETLIKYGFIKKDCIDINIAFKMTGKTRFKKWKGRNNKYCNCVEMVDIGVYNSCGHMCRYCYANYQEDKVCKNFKEHDVNSSLLIGKLEDDDVIHIKRN